MWWRWWCAMVRVVREWLCELARTWVVEGCQKTRSNAKFWAPRLFHGCSWMLHSSGNRRMLLSTSMSPPSVNSRLFTGRKRQITRTLQSDMAMVVVDRWCARV